MPGSITTATPDLASKLPEKLKPYYNENQSYHTQYFSKILQNLRNEVQTPQDCIQNADAY